MNKDYFDIRQTNIAKGVAILLLLWHHLFFNDLNIYERFSSVFLFHGIPIECKFADFCNVCVSMFVFLSGYGISKSWNKSFANYNPRLRQQIHFVLNKVVR